mmetsp:Transcript_100578/g.184276  ORF Transcript_100578/g.184276 Transcript_100578/m.184276 type:complete len:87 (-) Transcript_100578:8-268(-)
MHVGFASPSFVENAFVEGIVTGAMAMMWRLQVGVAARGSVGPSKREAFDASALLTRSIESRSLYRLLFWTMWHHHSSRVRMPDQFD